MELGNSDSKFCIKKSSVKEVQPPIAGVSRVKLLSSNFMMLTRFKRPMELGSESRQL
jgi:hypothetical protein